MTEAQALGYMRSETHNQAGEWGIKYVYCFKILCYENDNYRKTFMKTQFGAVFAYA